MLAVELVGGILGLAGMLAGLWWIIRRYPAARGRGQRLAVISQRSAGVTWCTAVAYLFAGMFWQLGAYAYEWDRSSMWNLPFAVPLAASLVSSLLALVAWLSVGDGTSDPSDRGFSRRAAAAIGVSILSLAVCAGWLVLGAIAMAGR